MKYDLIRLSSAMSSGRGMRPLRQWARYTCGILGAVLLTAAVSDPPMTGPVLSALAVPPIIQPIATWQDRVTE